MEPLENLSFLALLQRKEKVFEELRAINKMANRYKASRTEITVPHDERTYIIRQWNLGKSIPIIAHQFERNIAEINAVIEDYTISPYEIKKSSINFNQEDEKTES